MDRAGHAVADVGLDVVHDHRVFVRDGARVDRAVPFGRAARAGREDRVEVTAAAAARERLRLGEGWWLGCCFPARWAACDFLLLARGGWSRWRRIPLRVHPVRLPLPDLRGLLRARIFSCVRGRRDGADVFSWRMLLDAG